MDQETTEEQASIDGNLADDLRRLEAEAGGDTQGEIADTGPEVGTAEVLEMVLAPGFELLAPNWNITQGEIQQLAGAYGALIDKYLPDSLGRFGVELNAALVTIAILAPRVATPRKEKQDIKEREGSENADE